ncbi:MAG TPA: thioesterase family protein [Burkholderiales bacterium]|jgi:acyl-CoA thioester hydrolase|nr:thioesterase family protein [Burkholderiales bacterium]
MSLSAEVVIEVPFFDVDPMHVVWHGHYVKYVEQARCALLRRLDYDYPAMQASGYLWPVVELYLKYVNAARYGQQLRARALLLEYENRLKIGYLLTDAASGQRLTKGHSVQVAVSAATHELQFVSPAVLLDKVKTAR